MKFITYVILCIEQVMNEAELEDSVEVEIVEDLLMSKEFDDNDCYCEGFVDEDQNWMLLFDFARD